MKAEASYSEDETTVLSDSAAVIGALTRTTKSILLRTSDHRPNPDGYQYLLFVRIGENIF